MTSIVRARAPFTNYGVDHSGQVYNLESGKTLKGSTQNTIGIKDDSGTTKRVGIARFIKFVFDPQFDIFGKQEVYTSNGLASDLRPENLVTTRPSSRRRRNTGSKRITVLRTPTSGVTETYNSISAAAKAFGTKVDQIHKAIMDNTFAFGGTWSYLNGPAEDEKWYIISRGPYQGLHVSNTGRVMSADKRKIYKSFVNVHDKKVPVTTIICSAFNGYPKDGQVVKRRSGSSTSPSNLFWATAKERALAAAPQVKKNTQTGTRYFASALDAAAAEGISVYLMKKRCADADDATFEYIDAVQVPGNTVPDPTLTRRVIV